MTVYTPLGSQVAVYAVSHPKKSVSAIKAVVAATSHLSVRDGYALMAGGGIPAYERMRGSQDALEGPRAFSEKREPRWHGR